jgi:hypothetical protein
LIPVSARRAVCPVLRHCRSGACASAGGGLLRRKPPEL